MPRKVRDPGTASAGAAGSGTLWLGADEQLMVLSVGALVTRLTGALDDQLKRDSGISHYEYLVLAALSMAPERTLQMSDIAEFTDSTLSRLSNVATRLEARGWLHRGPDPQDARRTLATLTDEGMARVVAAAPGHVTEVRRLLLDPLSGTEQAHLRRICERILQAIDPLAWQTRRRLSRITRPQP